MFSRATIIITFLATTTLVHAGPQQEAEALAAQHQFVAAAVKYREAYALEHLPEQMCNVGVAYHKAGDLPRAQRYLHRCVALGKDLDRAYMDTAAKVLSSIEAQLASGPFASVALSVQPATAIVAIDGDAPFDERLVDGEHVWFPVGDYRVTVSADGFVTRQATLHATASTEVQYVLERAPVTARPESMQRISFLPPAIASGATLVAGAGALVFYAQMRDRAAQQRSATDPADIQRLRNEASSARNRMWVTGGLAGVGAVVSGYLWYRWRTDTIAVNVQSGRDGGATVTLGGVW